MAETLAYVTLVDPGSVEPAVDIAQLEHGEVLSICTKYGTVKILVRKMFNAGTDTVVTFHDTDGKQVGPLITQLFRKVP